MIKGLVMSIFYAAVFIGVGATLISDIWSVLINKLFGVPILNFSMVGRWICYFPTGKCIHEDIKQAKPIRIESWVGWSAHYLIGITFAILLLVIVGESWIDSPTFVPALILGIITVLAPYLLMQPGMGLGLAARKTPKPTISRLRSLMVHTVFGVGLYLSALLYKFIFI